MVPPMMRSLLLLGLLLPLASGCFRAPSDKEGAPCASTSECGEGYVCQQGGCHRREGAPGTSDSSTSGGPVGATGSTGTGGVVGSGASTVGGRGSTGATTTTVS